MSITKHADSHLDHSLTEAQVAFVLSLDPSKHGDLSAPVRAFSVEMPEELGTLPCALYGPVTGDSPVAEADVHYAPRGDRKGDSRLMISPRTSTGLSGTYEHRYTTGPRPSRLVTVVAGPHDGHDWVLFTAYGGPLAPREPFEDDSVEAKVFWAEHALAP